MVNFSMDNFRSTGSLFEQETGVSSRERSIVFTVSVFGDAGLRVVLAIFRSFKIDRIAIDTGWRLSSTGAGYSGLRLILQLLLWWLLINLARFCDRIFAIRIEATIDVNRAR